MLRMIVQMRIKIAAYAAVFLFAAAALPASAGSLTPVSYVVDVQGSSTSTLYFNNNQSTTQTFTGVTTYPYAPSPNSISAYTAGVQNSVASVNAYVSYPPVDPTVMATATAGSLPPGPQWFGCGPPSLGCAGAAELHVNVSGSISYQYAFEVASLNVVPVTVNVQGAITASGSNSAAIGNGFTSTAAITVANQSGATLGYYSVTNNNNNVTNNNNVNVPTYIPFNKQLNISTDTVYLVTLYASALAYSYSFDTNSGNNLLGSAYAYAAFDPTITCDPADPNCVGTTILYSANQTTPLPSTWIMLLSGFVGLGCFAYRGSKKNVALATA